MHTEWASALSDLVLFLLGPAWDRVFDLLWLIAVSRAGRKHQDQQPPSADEG
jgi:hypothetical protein